VEGLPKSSNKNAILVVVDRLTKYAHFLPLAHPFTAQPVAQLFMDNIFKLHGLQVAIVIDRDKIFTSKLWQDMFKALKVSLHYSSTYHPQSDGQTERVNQCLENYL
jgi:IS30 family transposase